MPRRTLISNPGATFMETLLWLLGYALAAGICILVGRGMWRAWRRHRARVREAMQQTPRPQPVAPRYPWHPTEDDYRPRPLRMHPGQIVEVPSDTTVHRLDYVDFWHQYAQERGERIPRTYTEALEFLGDVSVYLLTRAMADHDTMDILDRAIYAVNLAARGMRPRPRPRLHLD